MTSPGNPDSQDLSILRAQPLDTPGFARMFGDAALRLSPSSYRLMLLGDEGGLDIHFSFDDMLQRARLFSRHEEAFGWAAMSSDGELIHCALLDCLVRECSSQAGSWPAIERPAQSAKLPYMPGDGSMIAYSVASSSLKGQETLASVEHRLPELIPGARVSRIEPRLSLALAHALPGAQRDERARLLAAAAEAIAIGGESPRAPRFPTARL